MPGRVLRAGDGPVSPWSVPNLITITRIASVPVFVWLMLADAANPDTGHGAARWWAAALFIVAIATDAIDGHLARSRNLITDLGKLLDPIADKAITGAAFIMLSVVGELPWWVTAIVLVRELGITLWRLVMARRGVVLPAGRGGKAKTIAQAVALSLALLPLGEIVGDLPWQIANVICMSIAVALTVISGLDYLLAAARSTPEGGSASVPSVADSEGRT